MNPCPPFTARVTRQALRVYEASVTSRGWSIAQKAELYAAASVAWDGQRGQAERLAAFSRIYGELRGYWQVFRNARSHWPVERAFAELEAVGRADGLAGAALSDLVHDAKLRRAVASAVERILPIKTNPSGGHSAMAVSKFLHFRAPHLFPIYDRAVIELEVIRALRPAWKAIEPFEEFASVRDDQARQYLRYVHWLATLMQPHADQVMVVFADWFGRCCATDARHSDSHCWRHLQATAAEMILIGQVRGVGNSGTRE
jgi:hypothetical protein